MSGSNVRTKNMASLQKKPVISKNLKNRMRRALGRAIAHFGSQGKLALAIGVSQPSIAGALLRGKVSPALAESIHKVTLGKVPKWELRPDHFSKTGAK